jgi:hypothetical protein
MPSISRSASLRRSACRITAVWPPVAACKSRPGTICSKAIRPNSSDAFKSHLPPADRLLMLNLPVSSGAIPAVKPPTDRVRPPCRRNTAVMETAAASTRTIRLPQKEVKVIEFLIQRKESPGNAPGPRKIQRNATSQTNFQESIPHLANTSFASTRPARPPRSDLTTAVHSNSRRDHRRDNLQGTTPGEKRAR